MNEIDQDLSGELSLLSVKGNLVMASLIFSFNLFIASTIAAGVVYSASWGMTNVSASLIQCFFRLLFWSIITEKNEKAVGYEVFVPGKCLTGEQSLCPSIHFLQLFRDFFHMCNFFTFIRKITFLSFCCFEISDVICDNDRIHYIGFQSKVPLPQNAYFLNP